MNERPARDPAAEVPAPRVTVLMPARNAEGTIAEAIASILEQSFPDWELIVLDDGSTDHTAAIARRFADPRIRVQSDGRHLGRSARLNEGVGMARGEYVARMDADDLSFPDRLALQVAFLDAHPEVDLVASHMMLVDRYAERALGAVRWRGGSHTEITAHPASGFHFGQGGCMGRVRWFRTWPYDTRQERAEDDDQLLRSFDSSRFARLRDIRYAWRKGDPTFGSVLRGRLDLARAIARQGFARRRPGWIAAAVVQVCRLSVDAVQFAIAGGKYWVRWRTAPLERHEQDAWIEARARISDRLRRENAALRRS